MSRRKVKAVSLKSLTTADDGDARDAEPHAFGDDVVVPPPDAGVRQVEPPQPISLCLCLSLSLSLYIYIYTPTYMYIYMYTCV